MKSTVEKDFLTNTAVAWFSAGVIVPFLTPNLDGDIFTMILSGILTLGFLNMAKYSESRNI